jgi:peptidoglycan/LPS O-acetylase OafA/YrhL
VTIVNPPKRRNLLGTLSFFCALLAVLLSYSVPAAAGALSMFTGVGAIVALFLPRRRRPMAAWALVLSLLAFLLAATYTTMTLAS